jgi:hypothetical protein
MMKRSGLAIIVAIDALVFAVFLALTGCATLDSASAWWQSHVKPTPTTDPATPPASDAYVVRLGDQQCRELTAPAWLEIGAMTGKQPGTAEREEVTVWAYSGEWSGGNGTPGNFTVRANDSRPDWAKLKVYGLDAYAGEPALRMAWAPAESYTLRLAVSAGEVSWTAKRASDGATAEARQAAKTPERVTICYGDPGSRKAAIGAKLTGIAWSEP